MGSVNKYTRSAVVVLMLSFLGACKSMKVEGYNGPVSDHFDGVKFHNMGPFALRGLGAILKWRFTSHRLPWPEVIPIVPPPAVVPDSDPLHATFVNHATFLVEIGGVNVLTDPIWSERASPVSWAGPKRVRPPGIPFESLPRIDAVVISHNHYDHMDLPTLQRIEKAYRPVFLCGLGNKAFLEKFGLTHVRELDWWQKEKVGSADITFVPARHFSQRGFKDRMKTLWGGYVIEGAGKKLYFAGDTGYGEHFKMIEKRFGAVDMALLPIGAYEPRWFMGVVHTNPDDAVRAHLDLKAKKSVGMHFGTFRLSDEGYDQPEKDLEKSLDERHVSRDRFVVPKFGERL